MNSEDLTNILEKTQMKIAVANLEKENKFMKSKPKFKMVASFILVLILTSGIAFATNYNKIISCFGLGGGIDLAVEHGYIENPNMDYIESDTTAINENLGTIVDNVTASVKIEDFLMDDLNLSTHFLFEFDRKIDEVVNLDNLKNIELKDLLVTDENGKIIYCMNKEIFEKYCSENNLDYEFAEFNDNYYNCGINSYIEYHHKESGMAKLTYNMYSGGENFPKSKKLKFMFTKITLVENEKQGENIDSRNTVTLIGDWSISLDVPEKMFNRQTISYKVISCSNSDFEVTTATLYDTGFEFGAVISNMKKPDEDKLWGNHKSGSVSMESSEYKKWAEKNYSEWEPIYTLPHDSGLGETIEDTSYLENEKGQKFEISTSSSRRQNANFVENDKFDFYETFTLTKYEATDKIKVRLLYYGKPITIELEKNK